ncbi:MAG: hypothetical protein IJS61_03115 [Firmicutes bacterium]|nr:hypothetical protein [Bacillota bacterium]
MSVCILNELDVTNMLREYRVDVSDVDADSSRNTVGDLIRNRLATKEKIYLSFVPLNRQECAYVLEAVRNKFINVRYLSPLIGEGMKEGTFYVSDRTVPFLGIDEGLWRELSFTLTER